MPPMPEAICEAMSRPTMRFVPVKTRRAAGGVDAGRACAIGWCRTRTQLSNAIRGYAAEFGLTAAKGLDQDRAAAGAHCCGRTDAAAACAGAVRCAMPGTYARLKAQDRRGRSQADGVASGAMNCSRRLVKIPGDRPDRCLCWPMKAPDPEMFPIGPALRGLDRLDAEGSLHSRQGAARRDHAGRR